MMASTPKRLGNSEILTAHSTSENDIGAGQVRKRRSNGKFISRRICRYTGSDLPACRINHTGTRFTGKHRAARRSKSFFNCGFIVDRSYPKLTGVHLVFALAKNWLLMDFQFTPHCCKFTSWLYGCNAKHFADTFFHERLQVLLA